MPGKGRGEGLGGLLVEQLLGFVDFCGEVGTAATIGVVEQHDGSMGLADFFLGNGSLAFPRGQHQQRFGGDKGRIGFMGGKD